MVDYNLINSLGNLDDEVDSAVATALGDAAAISINSSRAKKFRTSRPAPSSRAKSPATPAMISSSNWGSNPKAFSKEREFDDPDNVKVGDEVRVLLEDVEGDTGLVKISKRKADRIINWEAIMKTKKEGDPGLGQSHQENQGRIARRYRRAGFPSGLPGGYSPARRNQRLDRPRHRCGDSQDRRRAPQHRHLPPQDDRAAARRAEAQDAGTA